MWRVRVVVHFGLSSSGFVFFFTFVYGHCCFGLIHACLVLFMHVCFLLFFTIGLLAGVVFCMFLGRSNKIG